MDTFGITAHGVPSEIALARREGFHEPSVPPPRLRGCPRRWLDPELPLADGLALRSRWRMGAQRRAGVCDPSGPLDRFRFPLTGNMDYGWALADPALRQMSFHCAPAHWPRPHCDVTRLWDERLQHCASELELRTRCPSELTEPKQSQRSLYSDETAAGVWLRRLGSAMRHERAPAPIAPPPLKFVRSSASITV